MEQNKLEKQLQILNEIVNYYLDKYFMHYQGLKKTWDDFKADGHFDKIIEIINTNIAEIEQVVDLKDFVRTKFKQNTNPEKKDDLKRNVDDILLENVKTLKARLEDKSTENQGLKTELNSLENEFNDFKKEVCKISVDQLQGFQAKLKNQMINELINEAVELYNRDVEKDDDPSINVDMFKDTIEYKRLIKNIILIDKNIQGADIAKKINYYGSAKHKYENNAIRCNIEGAKSLNWMRIPFFISNRKRWNKMRGVYIFWNQTKNLFYVGQSKNLRNRIGGYFDFETLECINKKFGQDYNNGDQFYLSIKKLDTSEKCDLIEKKFIKIFNSFKGPGYNRTSGNI